MTSNPDTRPFIYGSLILPTIQTAFAVQEIITGNAVDEMAVDSFEGEAAASSRVIDTLFPTGYSPDGPFTTPSEVYDWTNPDGEGENGYIICISTRPEDWDYSEHGEDIGTKLDAFAKAGVLGYIEVIYDHGGGRERMLYVLTPFGAHSETTPNIW